MTSHTSQTALITGGASGIGFELAKCFAHDGYQLVLVGKSRTHLQHAEKYFEQYYAIETLTIQADLTEKSSVLAVYDAVQKRGITIDVLVNNAGVGDFGYFHESDLDKIYAMVQLNIAAVMMLSQLFLKGMIYRNSGKVLNIASVTALQPSPLFACYGATKSFVVALSRAMQYEARQKAPNVTITTICPSATYNTGFAQVAGMGRHKIFQGFEAMDAAAVARMAYRSCEQGKECTVLPRWFGLFVQIANRMLPTRVMMWGVMQQLKP